MDPRAPQFHLQGIDMPNPMPPREIDQVGVPLIFLSNGEEIWFRLIATRAAQPGGGQSATDGAGAA